MAEGEAVKVAVRVRPFNGREKNMNAKLCIKMDGECAIFLSLISTFLSLISVPEMPLQCPCNVL